jgi:hypothetical protein
MLRNTVHTSASTYVTALLKVRSKLYINRMHDFALRDEIGPRGEL